ncbi:ATP-binding protein [Pseudomonas vanderleydeniana]|uniref:histidine kinase n=1 Tax=Pseudomonas vanderleydeniana TaxID=2745495 RepID=A0A9E6PR10_9PSED|nr:ATP-binding protein [Pseudomonas vanderleydeniana]QXI30608.1 sensor histidine kinase N-terminal domain-containing protein [Pseudomonas vanderleydeniana]
MMSIRTRILAPTLLLVIVGSLTLAWLALRDSHREIEEIYDAQMVQSARLLQGLLEQQPTRDTDWGRLQAAFGRAMSRIGNEGHMHPYETLLTFQIWDDQGRLLSRSLDAPALATPPPAGAHDFSDGDRQWCGFLLRDEQQGLQIWVGERDDLRQDLIQRIVQHTLWPTLIGLPLLVVVIWALLGWGLRPLQRLHRHLRNRAVDSLEPLQAGPLPPELQPMRATLDRLLEQLGRLLERERRFIADAAHELRTPLAVLDIHARNAQAATTAEERDEALAFLRQGVSRATRIVSQLLTMARLQPEDQPRQLLNLAALVREELAELTPLAWGRQVELILDSDDDVPLLADPTALSILLQNLVGNALNFAPAQSEIQIVLERSGPDTRLRIMDQGPGVSDELLGRLCDRFYSAGNPQGAGLGLSIVEVIARRLGGSLAFSNRAQGGLCVELNLPTPGDT